MAIHKKNILKLSEAMEQLEKENKSKTKQNKKNEVNPGVSKRDRS
jgi:hypothetical protein